MGFSRSEFYQLTYCELRLILEGRERAQKRTAESRRYEQAWKIAWLLAPHSDPDKEPLTPEKILGLPERHRRRVQRASVVESFDAYLAAREKHKAKQDQHDSPTGEAPDTQPAPQEQQP